jgi:hypothetical protein
MTMSDKSRDTRDTHYVPKETEQSEDKPKRPGVTFVTEEIINSGRDGIRRRLVRLRMPTEASEERED